jgi:hypothetical protein
MALVARLPCVCCERHPVQVHHTIHGRFSQRRSSDMHTIPLCLEHHWMLHEEPGVWRATYGNDTDHIEPTRRGVDRLRSETIGGRSYAADKVEKQEAIRRTFVVPDGYRAVRGADGRATGEIELIPQEEPK